MYNTIFSPPNDHFAVSPQAVITKPQTRRYCGFRKTPQRDRTPRKVQTSRQESIKPQGNEKEKIPAPQPTSTHKLSVMFMVWNISIGQPGSLPGCAPSQLLHSRSWAEYEKLQKVLDFLAITENISVINILLVLSSKHSSYWEEN